MDEKSDGSNPKGNGGDVPPERNVCSVCGKPAPATETDYTLISSQHGWRLSIQRAADGRRVSQWICKECWEAQGKPS